MGVLVFLNLINKDQVIGYRNANTLYYSKLHSKHVFIAFA